MSLPTRIGIIASELGYDEQRVLFEVARRLEMGQRHYGKLDIAKDPRDWHRELSEEVWDGLVYSALALIKSAP